MAKVRLAKRFYSTRSAVEYPNMLRGTLDDAIKQAEEKLMINGHDEIYIVEIVKVVKRHQPRPLFDLLDVTK